MILTISGRWTIDPAGPFREGSRSEDLWSLINSVNSLMTGRPLEPWFIGECHDASLVADGRSEVLVLEFYPGDGESTSVYEHLPSIMLATEIAMSKGFSSRDIDQLTLEMHPGEQPSSAGSFWWDNYFNHRHRDATWSLEISPPNPNFAHHAASALPHLFQKNGDSLESYSWGVVEFAALVDTLTRVTSDWEEISVVSRRTPGVQLDDV